MSRYIITGAKGGSTQGADAPNRLEINDLVKDQEQFSLYIQALDAMSSDQQSNDISFFGIGGIHGLPYVQWDGSGGTKPVTGSEWGGYCFHGSTLFPTWHRPYLALFEQVLQQHAIAIAGKYTVDQELWKAAAANLRAPYWDWASNSVPPPEVISLTTVNIIKPDGTSGQVANPLLKYKFHPIDKSFPAPYSGWQTTLRQPTSTRPNATSDIDELKDTLSASQEDITTSTYNLLTRVHTWPAFSNHTPGDGGSSSNSLEAIHDGIHVDVGGQGQMSDPAVAGFDPIFFLHHSNVDRMLSLWFALNPNVWVTKGPATDGTFTVAANAPVDAKSALTPFFDSQTGYWASSEVTATSKLGYTYPEFNGLDMGNTSVVQGAIAKIVSQLYGGPISNIVTSMSTSFASDNAQATDTGASKTSEDSAAPAGAQAPLSVQSVNQPGTAAGNAFFDWAARIRVKKYEVGGSFSVLIFLGKVPEDPRRWRSSPSFVGAHHAFVNSAANRCENCRNQADIVIEGFVHLNSAIARLSGLGSFDPAVVVPYLKREMSWRVQKVDKTEVNLADVPSLEVTVSATPITLEPGAVLPTTGECHYHHDVTAGRRGGHRSA